MGLSIIYRPVSSWPGPRTRDEDRVYSDFSANWRETVDVLARELRALGADECVLELDADEGCFRVDGSGLRADRKVKTPGVVVSFTSAEHGPLRYACDRFVARGWQGRMQDSWRHNVRAVALGLEALRRVERYGIARRGEQYVGWKALGSGIPMGAAAQMTADDAARILAGGAGWEPVDDEAAMILEDPDLLVPDAYRLAAKRWHPDAPGGDAARFRRITEARDLLLRLA